MSVSTGDGVSLTFVQPNIYRGSVQPSSGNKGDLWMDTSVTPPILYECSVAPSTWVPVSTGGGSQSAILFDDEGVPLGTAGTVDTVDFVGAGVTATRASNKVTVTIPGGGGSAQAQIQFKDEGSNLGTTGTVDSVDFTGTGVTASRVGNALTVNVPTPSSQTQIQWQDEGSNLGATGTVDTVNAVGGGITATRSVNTITLTVPTPTVYQTQITYKDEGVALGTTGTVDTVDFVGGGVTATRASNTVTVTVPTPTVYQSQIQFEDEGSNLGAAGTVTELDFTGAGVTATRSVNKVTVAISGSGSGQTGIQFQDEGSNLGTSGTADTVNFTGSGVTASRASNTVTVNVSGGGSSVSTCFPGGRLTLTSGDPCSPADVSTSTSVYYTPYLSNICPLWDGSQWSDTAFTQKTLALGTKSTDTNYDVFAYLSAGALALEDLAWTNDTTRATGISIQDGKYCKTGDHTRLYLGTYRTISTTETCDYSVNLGAGTGFPGRRYLWNMYNRITKTVRVRDDSANESYNSTTIKIFNYGTGSYNWVQYIVGLAEDTVVAFVGHSAGFSGAVANGAFVGVGVDSTTTISSTGLDPLVYMPVTIGDYHNLFGRYSGVPSGVGLHQLYWLIYTYGTGGGTVIFLKGTDYGLQAEVKC